MSAPQLRHTTEVWAFDPPVPCVRAYSNGTATILVHYLHRTVAADGSVRLAVKGKPTTRTGKPTGGIDWRTVTDAEEQRLHRMVLAVRGEQ